MRFLQLGYPRRRSRRTLSLVLALSVAVPTLAQTRVIREGRGWVEETSGSLPKARSLRVNTALGNVTVQSGSRELRYVVRKLSQESSEQAARKQFAALRISAHRRGKFAVLQGAGRRSEGPVATDILLVVPRELDIVDVDTLGGNIVVTSSAGRLDLGTRAGNVHVGTASNVVRVRTMGGNVTLDAAGANVVIRSGGGDIRVGNARGRVEVSTLGGNIYLHSVGAASVQAHGGNIQVDQCRGDLVAHTSGGSIELGAVGGSASIGTGGGNIHLGGAHGRVEAVTAAGNIEMWKLASGALAQSGAGTITAEFVGAGDKVRESVLHTSSGNVVIYLGRETPATVKALNERALGRGIHSEFPELRVSSDGGYIRPRMVYAEGVLNGGGPVLKVRTAVGQIDFRRLK